MKINILLPYKELFSQNYASSVSITIKNNLKFSKYKKNIKVFGRKIDQPFFKDNYIGLDSNWIFYGGRNKGMANSFCKQVSKQNNHKQLIELHNRPYLFNYIRKRINKHPIFIHFHNDPTTMKGSKSIKERKEILENASAIFCVSKFVKKRFLEGINTNYNNIYVIYNGVERTLHSQPIKKKEVLFVGRLVKEKGIDIFVNAISRISDKFKDWKFSIIGTPYAGMAKLKSGYAYNIIKKFNKIGDQTKYYGFLNNDNVQIKMQQASIVVVPSIWEEPYGLVVAEAMSNGSALIVSNRGGIPEIVSNNGIIISDINDQKLSSSLSDLMFDSKLLKSLQNKSWNNFNVNIKNIVPQIDSFRENIFNNYYNLVQE